MSNLYSNHSSALILLRNRTPEIFFHFTTHWEGDLSDLPAVSEFRKFLLEEAGVGPCHNPCDSPKGMSSLGKTSEFMLLGQSQLCRTGS